MNHAKRLTALHRAVESSSAPIACRASSARYRYRASSAPIRCRASSVHSHCLDKSSIVTSEIIYSYSKHTTLLPDSLFPFFQLPSKWMIDFVHLYILKSLVEFSDVMRCLCSNWTISVSGVCLQSMDLSTISTNTSISAVNESFLYLLTYFFDQ